MFDTRSDMQVARSANLTVGNNVQVTALVDMRGFKGLTAYVDTQTITAAGAGIAFKLQHSNSTVAGTFVDVPAAQVLGAIDPVEDDADDDKLMPGSLGYVGKLRYVRLVATGGASTNGVLKAIFVRSKNDNVTAPLASVFALTAAT
jgi:hypothetical protein